VATKLLGGSEAQIVDALSHAWIDGGALRTYRHAPNTGSRKRTFCSVAPLITETLPPRQWFCGTKP